MPPKTEKAQQVSGQATARRTQRFLLSLRKFAENKVTNIEASGGAASREALGRAPSKRVTPTPSLGHQYRH